MRSWDSEIELLQFVESEDSSGFATEGQEQGIKILSNEIPVHSANFYGAAQAGFLISKVFEVHTLEFEGQTTLKFDGERYRIRRTFGGKQFTELHCERQDTNHI